VRVPVLDAEARELGEERLLRLAQRDPVLRPARPGKGRLHGREVEVDDLRVRRRVVRVVPERVLLAVRLDERDPLLRPPGQAQVADGLGVDGEEPARRPVLRRHVPDRRAVGDRKPLEAVAEVLDELPDDARLAQDLRHRQDEVRRRRALRQLAHELEADDLWDEHRDGLAQHRRLGLDAAHAPSEHAEPVDHRRVRVRAEERVGERHSVAVLDDAAEELEVHLVHDPGRGRDDLQVRERALPPAQEGVALAVPLELELRVAEDRERRRELVHLHRVVDDELGGKLRVDLRRVAAEGVHRVPHRREVDDGRDAREVLVDDAPGIERDRLRGLGRGHPPRDGLDVGGGDGGSVLVAQDVLEQDPQRVRKAEHVEAALQRLQAEDLELPPSCREPRARAEAVRVCHLTRFKQLGLPQPSEAVQAALRQGLPPWIEVPRDRRGVGLADAQRVGPEPLVADGSEILPVGVEHVLPPHVARGVEERDPDPERDLEQAAPLAVGLAHERLVDLRELPRARQARGVVPEVRERLPERLQLERGDVDQARRRAARPLERGEEVGDGAEPGALRENSRALELADEGIQVDARAVRDVGRGGEEPERREAEGGDGAELDRVAERLAHREPAGRRLDFACGRRPLDATDELDRDPEQVLRGRLVQARAPDEARQDEVGRLGDGASSGGRDRPEDALGKREDVRERADETATGHGYHDRPWTPRRSASSSRRPSPTRTSSPCRTGRGRATTSR
jgi:hypothetical protein